MKNLLKSKKAILVAIIIAFFGYAGINVSDKTVTNIVDIALTEPSHTPPAAKEDFNAASHISAERQKHILYGDNTGGGHMHGTNKPCKSEFPLNWNADKIITQIDGIAANDNLNWEKQDNGYHVTEKSIDGLNIRVVKGRQNQQVITAYPTNVKRNPCPKTPTNDG